MTAFFIVIMHMIGEKWSDTASLKVQKGHLPDNALQIWITEFGIFFFFSSTVYHFVASG